MDQLVDGLASGSRVELPTNVVAEIRTWAALRERITVRRSADMLEFPDAEERERAVTSGMPGVAVGERFLLLPGTFTPLDFPSRPAAGHIHVTEEGALTLAWERRDLLTIGYLTLWTERRGEDEWWFTRASVAAAAKRGRTVADLLAFLHDRQSSIPGILLVALRSWAGESHGVKMTKAVILRCSKPEVMRAIVGSKALKPHILTRLAPDAILVDGESADEVRAILDWAGVHV